MSIFSKSCEYGLRAALYMATYRKERRFVPIREMSSKLDISFHFLTKILQQLTEAKLMTSYRGPKGGVTLAKEPSEIKLMDIVHAIDGDDLFLKCILGLSACSSKKPCPLHHTWGKMREDLVKALEEVNLGDLRIPVERTEIRLADAITHAWRGDKAARSTKPARTRAAAQP